MTPDTHNITIQPEITPNPNSLRFMLDRKILDQGTVEMKDATQAPRSPLAQKLFQLDEVRSVFLGPDFVTVTARNGINWEVLAPRVIETLRAHLAAGETILHGPPDAAAPETDPGGHSEVEQGIIRLIEEEIRPAVAMDGGDVVFAGYRDGVVMLQLRGACAGCPSATMTLKMGIERRLKEEFPEIVSVEPV